MATSVIAEENATDIREGLICPICMRDLGTINQLLNHFEEAHNSEEDKDVLQSFKDFLGKAKKILKSDNPFELLENKQQARGNTQPLSVDVFDREIQEFGSMRSHWSDFRKLRNNRMDYYAAETNKLIIRLDKIISCLPNEAGKRREHEQNVVAWVNDEDVKLCPQCARTFNLFRRKHHCRVCGTVQCHECSQFLLLSFARKLINPGYIPPATNADHYESFPPERLALSAFQALKRAGSSTSLSSLTSLVDPSTGEGRIRVCNYCKQLLERREQQMDDGSQKPPLVELYEELRKHMDKGSELVPTFLKMFDSLSQGESTYNLKDAQDCRLKLLKIAEYVEGYSKKIMTLGLNDVKNPTFGSALSLQQKIRLSAVNYLKENIMGLPNLPSEGKLVKLQENRRYAIERRIEQEKLAVFESREMETKRRHHLHPKDTEAISVDRGWGVETSHIVNDYDDDPMLQQMQIIRNYIHQARRDHRYDEVSMLESNLKELEIEHQKMLQHHS